ncbi:hypothetical protein M1563_01510 [Patescibacteria group bacterium]|nr:hypothetical protein [Patescibacteria group bacterium]MCL5409534.1 hypothetical protein [Patescibacteria group bacterium]
MKKILVFLLLGFFVTTKPVFAQMGYGMMGDFNDQSQESSDSATSAQQDLTNLVNQLLQSQGVSNTNQLDCSKINADQLEQLGDAWMDVQIGNQQAHQAMDQMMGGEGSVSLNNAHLIMAENYLGCSNRQQLANPDSNATSSGFWPMMLGLNGGGGFNMMGYGYGGNFGAGALGFLTWLVVLVDLILLGIYLWQKVRK